MAVDFFFNELVNQDSLFYVEDQSGQLLNISPLTFLEDSLFVDGLFYWKKIFMSNKVNTLSEPKYDIAFLSGIAEGFLNEREIKEAEELLKDFEIKSNIALPSFNIDIPSTISIVKTNHFENNYINNSLYLRVGHHLESSSRLLVSISVYNLEYNEYKNIIVLMDKKCRVLDWSMP